MAYFDNAATTYPKPGSVYDYMDQFYRGSAGSAGRGNYHGSIKTGQLIDDTRKKIQQLLHCEAKQVMFEPTATISLNIILQGLVSAGKRNFYISPFEHNAVTRTLHHFEKAGQIIVRTLTVNENLQYDLERIRYQFDDLKPEVVIVSHASNVIGLIAPVEEIFLLAKKYDAITVADMSQTCGLVDCNVGLQTFDFAVFAGHKTMYGPTGISGFVMNPEIRLPSVLFGGTGYESANQDMPESLPQKFEFGTLNTSGIAGLNAAVRWLLETGIENIWNREQAHREKLIEILSGYPFLHIVGNVPENRYVGIVSCLMDGISSDTAGSIFDERNISIRTGLQCAPLAHKTIGTYPEGTLRFSVSYFTGKQDFDELTTALDDIEANL